MVKDHNGNVFATVTEMCKHWNVTVSAFYGRKAKGLSLQEILEQPAQIAPKNAKPIEDHMGNQFSSISAMCKHYKIPTSTFINRMDEQKMSLEEALTCNVRYHETTDHLGNTFPSKKAMCKHYGISVAAFDARLESGMSLKESLLTPSKKTGAVDHLGNHFPSKKAMCEHYHISQSSFDDRIKKGMSLEDALTTEKKSGIINVQDHLGNTFRTKTEMAAYYGMSEKRYVERRRNGLSKKDALTLPMYYNKPTESFTDHMGNQFHSIKEMAEYWDQNEATLYHRLKTMSIEDALTRPTGWRSDIRDHTGKVYKSIADMCRCYNMNVTTYMYRIKNDWPVSAALLLDQHIHLTNNMVIYQGYTILKKLSHDYYECCINSEKVIRSQRQILSDMAEYIMNERKSK